MKKILSGALALTIAAGMYCAPVYAQDDTAAETELASINPEPGVSESDMEADFQIEGRTLVKYNGSAAEVTIPSTVNTIGREAFYENKTVTKIVIPDTVTEIEDGQYLVHPVQFTKWEYHGAFAKCSNLKSVTFGSGLTKIGDNAFSECSNLEAIQLPDSVTSIGSRAFEKCSTLASLDITNTSVKTIGEYAFSGCTNAVKAKLPDTVTDLGEGAFSECNNLVIATLSANLTAIDDSTFKKTKIQKINIPASVTKIGNDAFLECRDLEDVTFGDNIVSIGDQAFKSCAKLSKMSAFPSALKTIGYDAFHSCPLLPTPDLKRTSLESIGSFAFYNCDSIKKIELPDTLTELAFGAFNSCDSLSECILSNNLKTINTRTFQDSGLERIVIPDSVTTIADGANRTDPIYFTVTYHEGAFSQCKKLKEVVIGSGVETIGVFAFIDCNALENVTFGKNVQTLGKSAFSGCSSLKSADLSGTKLETIADEVFLGCSSVETVKLPDTVTKMTSYNVFNDCGKLKNLDLGNSIITLNCMFRGCGSLNELTFGKSLTSIVGKTFEGSPNIYDIYYGGTKSDWDELLVTHKDSNLVKMKDQYCVHCTDGDIAGPNYIKKTLDSITVTPPTKTTYEIGETLDVTGGTVQAFYSDGTFDEAVPLTLDMCSGFDSSTAGQKTVTVTYENKTATFNVTVRDGSVTPTMESISARLAEGYTIYKGDELDKSKILITVNYSDGSTAAVIGSDSGVTITGYSKTKVGDQTITIKYSGKTTTLVITVLDKGAPVPTGAITLNGEPVASYEAAIKDIGGKAGDYTITIDAPIKVSKFTFPQRASLTIIASENGRISTSATSLAPTKALTLECPITNEKGKNIAINAKSDLTLTGGSFGNITVQGSANLTDVVVNGTVKFSAKADKEGLVTDTLTGVTATKGVNSNNNVVFVDCPSLGTINVKGTVKISGAAAKCVALTAASKFGTSEVENLTVDKKISIAGSIIADGLTAGGALDVKNYASLTDCTVAGKINVKGLLSVNGDVLCRGAVSCAQLTSDETACLTYMSLAVTKTGIAADSADITVKVIDKNGVPVQCVAGKKTAVVVKSFKLPKGGTYNPVLILHEACGNGTLTFFKNKIVLV